jgi:shikimate kinase
MGAGKSTVGKLLAGLLGWKFLDADHLLTRQTRSTIAELFARHGEEHFRSQEALLIASLFNHRDAVIALGGGAVEHPATARALAAAASPATAHTAGTPVDQQAGTTLVVYLETPLALSLERCAAEPGAAIRPVLQDTRALEERFSRRLPLYQTAGLTVQTAARTPAEVAAHIAAHLQAGDRADESSLLHPHPFPPSSIS